MQLHEAFRRVLSEFPGARSAALEAHNLARFVRGDAPKAVNEALGDLGEGLLVQGSPGQGNWAAVPWISIFDPTVTTSATRGYYPVYLFHATEPRFHISLNQGTTAVREEFASRARSVLRDRAEFIRKRLADFVELLPISEISLGSDSRLPGDYVAGHALGQSYELDNLPDEAKLRSDLQNVVRAYRALTFRGGIEGDVESQAQIQVEFNISPAATVIETRRYAYHRKIERNSTAAKNAKKFHGTTCQACELSFPSRYGDLGKGYIEAHHLRPIGTLEEGKPVRYDVASDFAVLCANCHRMIHRTDDPSDLVAFKKLIISS